MGGDRSDDAPWAGSAAGEQMGDVCSHFRVVAEYGPGGVRSLARNTPLAPAAADAWTQADAGVAMTTGRARAAGDNCRGGKMTGC